MEEDLLWHDMSIDDQRAYVEKESERIARRLSRKVISSSKRSEKKVGAEDGQVLRTISARVVEKMSNTFLP